MARYCKPLDAQPLIDAGATWIDKCLAQGLSIFTDRPLWNSENLQALVTYFTDNPETGSGSFFEKLETQLLDCNAEAKQLAAEILWLMLLSPHNIGPAKKRESITRVWSWSGDELDTDQQMLSNDTLNGVGSAGTSFNTNRWRELAYAIGVFKAAFEMPVPDRKSVFGDFNELGLWLASVPGNEQRQFRHMLMYMLHPDEAERIFSGGDRRTILKRFTNTTAKQAGELTAFEIDKMLLNVRQEKEAEFSTKELDFYQSPLKEQWTKTPQQEAQPTPETEPAIKKMNVNSDIAVNKILYGPPGTGKTYELNQLKQLYTTEQKAIPHEQWLSEQLKAATWFDVVFMCLCDLGQPAKVKDIERHPFFVQKAKAVGRHQHLKAQIWATLQSHTIESSDTVNYKNRIVPLVFDKGTESQWRLAGNWQEDGEDLVQEVNRLAAGAPSQANQTHYAFVTFHQAYSYEDFVEGIRPVQDPETDQMAYRVEPGIFRQICQDAKNAPDTQFALFIDEINRGNIAKIFGELITLIEPDKRALYDDTGKLVKGMELILPYSRERFGVPGNLDIYATMNTADRSIALLDTALRRRFQFQELMPDLTTIDGATGDGCIDDDEGGTIDLRQLLSVMNQRIQFLLSRDLTLGHAYFINVTDFPCLRATFLSQLVPLLQEYFYSDWHRIQLILGDVGPDNSPVEHQIVAHTVLKGVDVLGFEHDDFEDTLEYRVVTPEQLTPQAVRKIYERKEWGP